MSHGSCVQESASVKSDVDPKTVFRNLKKVGEGSSGTVYAYLYQACMCMDIRCARVWASTAM